MSIFEGTDDKEFVVDGETITDVLIRMGNEVTALLKKEIQDNVSDGTTKQLEQSVLFLPIQVKGNSYTLEFQANDYFKFIDQGVKGAMNPRKTKGSPFRQKAPNSPFSFKKPPPVKALSFWAYMKDKNVYALQKSLFNQGIAPRNILDQVVTTELTERLQKEIENITGKVLELSISESFNGK